ncbi:hypothetical protein IHE44_0012244 [Lamprotornis superbus]|uniref:Uncharacterized protein n=1 Tax=Lamprotornis superbus TaxID=245042 RepID=A0A835NRB8_9PASS|nr:hypothetical protein IHE44_0012244 [Lamprotornis superbus]
MEVCPALLVVTHCTPGNSGLRRSEEHKGTFTCGKAEVGKAELIQWKQPMSAKKGSKIRAKSVISDFVCNAEAGTQMILLLCLARDSQELLQSEVRIESHSSSVLDTFLLLPRGHGPTISLLWPAKERGKGQDTDCNLRHKDAMDVMPMEQGAAESWYLGCLPYRLRGA